MMYLKSIGKNGTNSKYGVIPLGRDTKCESVFNDKQLKLIYKCDTNPVLHNRSDFNLIMPLNYEHIKIILLSATCF